jgi:hypothetical protein
MPVPRYFHKELAQYFTLPGTIIAPIQITFGAASVASFKGMFLQSVVRNSAGNYTLTFERPLRYFLGATGTHWKVAGATEPLTVCSTSASVDNTGTGALPNTMTIETRAAAVATDPANGDTLYWWPAWNETQVL